MPLDPLRAVGAVQVGAAVGAEVVAGLYVDHRVSAYGALLFLACRHLPYAGIRSILLMPAGTVPAAAVTLLVCVPAPELPHAGIASQMWPRPENRLRPPHVQRHKMDQAPLPHQCALPHPGASRAPTATRAWPHMHGHSSDPALLTRQGTLPPSGVLPSSCSSLSLVACAKE